MDAIRLMKSLDHAENDARQARRADLVTRVQNLRDEIVRRPGDETIEAEVYDLEELAVFARNHACSAA